MLLIIAAVSFTLYSNESKENNNNSTEQSLNETFILLHLKTPMEDMMRDTSNHTNVKDCEDAFSFGEESLRKRDELEKNTTYLAKDTPSFRHQKVISSTDKGRFLARSGFAEIEASKHFFKRFVYLRRDFKAKVKNVILGTDQKILQPLSGVPNGTQRMFSTVL